VPVVSSRSESAARAHLEKARTGTANGRRRSRNNSLIEESLPFLDTVGFRMRNHEARDFPMNHENALDLDHAGVVHPSANVSALACGRNATGGTTVRF
jgi:hypothetical protein